MEYLNSKDINSAPSSTHKQLRKQPNRACAETRGNSFYKPDTLTAVLIDGEFFLKRFRNIFPHIETPQEIAKEIKTLSIKHTERINSYLYRIFFYDCKPFNNRSHNPVSKRSIDFKREPVHEFRTMLHNELRKLPKTALRLGYLKGDKWILNEDKLKALLQKQITVDDLKPEDVHFNLRQKEVDIKIGIDIASLSINKMIQNIVLIAGDGDFVPASKLARRNGICFILDPIWNPIDDSLHEHIDGLYSIYPNPNNHYK